MHFAWWFWEKKKRPKKIQSGEENDAENEVNEWKKYEESELMKKRPREKERESKWGGREINRGGGGPQKKPVQPISSHNLRFLSSKKKYDSLSVFNSSIHGSVIVVVVNELEHKIVSNSSLFLVSYRPLLVCVCLMHCNNTCFTGRNSPTETKV